MTLQRPRIITRDAESESVASTMSRHISVQKENISTTNEPRLLLLIWLASNQRATTSSSMSHYIFDQWAITYSSLNQHISKQWASTSSVNEPPHLQTIVEWFISLLPFYSGEKTIFIKLTIFFTEINERKNKRKSYIKLKETSWATSTIFVQ